MSSKYRTKQGKLRMRYAIPVGIPPLVLLALALFPDWPLPTSLIFFAAYTVTFGVALRFIHGDQREQQRAARNVALAHKLALAVNTGKPQPRAVRRANRITGQDHARALDALIALSDHVPSIRVGGSIHRALVRAAQTTEETPVTTSGICGISPVQRLSE